MFSLEQIKEQREQYAAMEREILQDIAARANLFG